jgi:tRNA nucleotidyltransferase (CCA-adding enzyme)
MKRYLVGGAVRDKLLGRAVTERDWVVVGSTPEKMLADGYLQVGGNFPVFLHPETKEEYALARSELKTGPGYKGFKFDFSPDISLEDDLRRRDLTVNAMAEDDKGKIIDPYNGQKDLQQRVLRHVSPAFVEDPLRVLRVARFMAQLGEFDFHIADETLALMKQIVGNGEIQHLVPERVWGELHKALKSSAPERFIESLHACGALPALLATDDFDGSAAMAALLQSKSLSADPQVRFAAMLAAAGNAQLITDLGERLRIPKAFTELAELVKQHHAFFEASIELPPPDILNGLKALDAFRRPERFEQFLLAAEVVSRSQPGRESWPVPQREYLYTAHAQAAAINARDLTKVRLEGEVLALELDMHRKAAISKVKRTYRWAKFN